MARDTDKDWQQVAVDDPYWGVLSAEDFRSTKLTEETRAQFFRSGEQFVTHLLALIARHFDPAFKPRRVLDFGCGVGRLAIPFARRTEEEVVGVDIAPAMLQLCRDNAAKLGVGNLTAVQGDDHLTAVTGKFSLVNTYIVLQHIDPARGIVLIQQLLDLVEPGGYASLQLTYGKDRRFWPHEAPRARLYRREGGTIVDLLPTDDGRPVGTITMFDYDLNQVFAAVNAVAGGPVLVQPTGDDGHLGVHVLVRKRAG
jgi:SAM-dependent methyltransferase